MQLIGRLMQARKVDNGTTNWWDVPPQTLAQMVVNAGLAPSVASGATGSMPTAGTAGRIYFATDSRLIYRDTGSAWETYPPPGGVGGATETTSGVAELATQTEVNAGTDDARIVTPLKLASRTGSDTRAGVVSLTSAGSSVAIAQNDPAFSDYKSGLQLQRLSATQIRINPGSCFIQSLGRIYNFPSAIDITPTLSANALLYVYVYDSAGTPFAEAVSAVPSAPYKGFARSKSGDTTRRLVGAVKVNAAGNAILSFGDQRSWIMYRESVAAAPLEVLGGGNSLSEQNVSCAGVVPAHSQLAVIQLQQGFGHGLYLGHSEDNITLSPTVFLQELSYGGGIVDSRMVELDSLQRFSYMFQSGFGTPGGGQGLYARVRGYLNSC